MTDALKLDLLNHAGVNILTTTDRIIDWDRQSTCDEWTVGQLVDHVIGGNWFTLAILEGLSADEALERAHAGFSDGYDRRSAASSSTVQQLQAFSEPGALDRCVDHATSAISARVALTFRLHDLIIHAWDVRETTDPGFRLNKRLVDWSHSDLVDPDSPAASAFGIDPALLRRTDLSQLDRLLAAFGRSRSR